MSDTLASADPDGVESIPIDVTVVGGVARVILLGELDFSMLDRLHVSLENSPPEATRFLQLDLSRLVFADTAAVRRLAAFTTAARRAGQHFETIGATGPSARSQLGCSCTTSSGSPARDPMKALTGQAREDAQRPNSGSRVTHSKGDQMRQGTPLNADAGAAAPHVWVLPSEPASAGVLRRELRALLLSLPPAQVDDLVLAASEVVANAVLHGEGPVTVWVWPGGHGLTVEVTDSGGGTPQLRKAIHRQEGGGRGLFIVDEIANRWGVIPSDPGPGKTLWFEIDSAPDETASSSRSQAHTS